MRILIIGGTGVISTAMSRLLIADHADLTLINRGNTPPRFGTGAKHMVGDRKDTAAFQAQIEAAGEWDVVVDMICFTPDQAQQSVELFRGRTQQFVFCSTVDVYYRTPDSYPITESHPLEGSSQYGRDKVTCERIFMDAHARGDFATTIIRPAQTYGEGGRLVHSLGFSTTYFDRLRKGKPIIVHGDGTSLWVTCHVDDLAPAFNAALGNPATYGSAYHITGEQWMTWLQYHRGVAEALGAPPPTFVPIPTDLLAQLLPDRAAISQNNLQFHNIFDNTAAKRDLGFRQTIGWVEGVRRTVAWLDEQGRILNSDDDPAEDRVIAAWRDHAQQLIATAAVSG
jgi:nucleoside-diphosphate-sugar epimerase